MKSIVRLYWKIRLRIVNLSFGKRSYLDAYADRTNALAMVDPEIAIGGLWDEMGRMQFEFLCANGLKPESTLLDIGCGTLRGGRHFIGFLNKCNYFGFDISSNAIRKAKELIEEEGLVDKSPQLQINLQKDLKFQDYQGRDFDYILAQSVFSHLQPEHIEEAFAHVTSVMHSESQFFFTFHKGSTYQRRDEINFEYPLSFFSELAARYGMVCKDFSKLYSHPRSQSMVRLTLESSEP